MTNADTSSSGNLHAVPDILGDVLTYSMKYWAWGRNASSPQNFMGPPV
jgi:hypothetical protein